MAQKSVYLNLRDETDLNSILDSFYISTRQELEKGNLPKFKNMLELAKSEVTIITAIHKIKSNNGSKTAGTDGKTITDILKQQYPDVIRGIRDALDNYNPHLLRREWIPKPGKTEKRPLGIPMVCS
ncbi:hypothetical protein [Desulfosporosinus acidiphilus]|uniref:hypothetical protein n=1 Tax=Desulfosporosinus acidiphilus TaxID=885581 RepID=UPI000257B73D|nr:hypothetical protein [Desulfosporosinus acidiphilus]